MMYDNDNNNNTDNDNHDSNDNANNNHNHTTTTNNNDNNENNNSNNNTSQVKARLSSFSSVFCRLRSTSVASSTSARNQTFMDRFLFYLVGSRFVKSRSGR